MIIYINTVTDKKLTTITDIDMCSDLDTLYSLLYDTEGEYDSDTLKVYNAENADPSTWVEVPVAEIETEYSAWADEEDDRLALEFDDDFDEEDEENPVISNVA